MLKRISWRIQPIEHIRKRKQRHKEMLQREKKFADFIKREKENRWNTLLVSVVARIQRLCF